MYLISEKNKNEIDKFCSDFIKKIESKDLEYIKSEADILLYISEITGTKYESDSLISLGNTIIKNYVTKLESNEFLDKGMFHQFGLLTFAINTIYNKTGELKKINNTLNKSLLDYHSERIDFLMTKPVESNDFDCINGVSGVLYYLLNKDIKNMDDKKINKLINYLIYLSDSHEYKGNSIINFYITREMQFTDQDFENFKNGNINFGISHGMMGPLIALNEAYNKFSKSDDILNAIKKLYKIYEDFTVQKNEILYYPTQLAIEDYFIFNKQKDSIKNNNASWCYGNISNVLSLTKISKYLFDEDKRIYKYYKQKLLNIINQPVEDYLLTYPILCHGFAGIIDEQVSAYEITKDEKFLCTLDRNIDNLFISYKKWNRIYELKEDSLGCMTEFNFNIQGYKNDLTFLNGSGGIFLTFLNLMHNQNNYKTLLMID